MFSRFPILWTCTVLGEGGRIARNQVVSGSVAIPETSRIATSEGPVMSKMFLCGGFEFQETNAS